MGTLTREQKNAVDLLGVRSTKRYFDKKGRARFAGTKSLRATGTLILINAKHLHVATDVFGFQLIVLFHCTTMSLHYNLGTYIHN